VLVYDRNGRDTSFIKDNICAFEMQEKNKNILFGHIKDILEMVANDVIIVFTRFVNIPLEIIF